MVNLLFLDLLGGVALLLWGLHMVHSGVVRAFGSDLRHLLNVALRNRFSAFLAGILVTALLQSSTATGLMITSFAAGGLVALVPALAIMLGANVGTALIVQVLSFNVSARTSTLTASSFRSRPNAPAAGSATTVAAPGQLRRPGEQRKLVFASFLMLFIELALIRWVTANNVYVTKATNLIPLPDSSCSTSIVAQKS